MTLYIENEQEHEISFDYEKWTQKLILHTLQKEDCPYEVEVSIVITDDETIQKTNAQFRNLDRSTDVLSFPMCNYEAPADFDRIEEQDVFHPQTGELLLGDIMISYDHVINQAKEYGHSVLREFSFLVVHSMLHLLGYDHEVEEERILMEEKQENILTELQILRD